MNLAIRFAPAVVDPSELKDRVGARVRVVTPAGLRVGLAKRVFAREPLLPSDVETEEEQQVGVEFETLFGEIWVMAVGTYGKDCSNFPFNHSCRPLVLVMMRMKWGVFVLQLR